MAEHQETGYSLPTQEESVDKAMMRRPVRSIGQQVRDAVLNEDALMLSMMVSASALALFPQSWIFVVPAALGYYSYATTRKFRLPFKVPQGWGGTDYGSVRPGGNGYAEASGILYFGQDQRTKEELWIENGDARRHAFILGTTGSGKALPLDTPVLTPQGWRFNGDLRPGDEVIHPSGSRSKVVSVHPQGAVKGVRLTFSDGRHADCSLEHLWHVKARSRVDLMAVPEVPEEGRLMEAGDIGILQGLYGDRMIITIPRAAPHSGFPVDPDSDFLSDEDAARAAREGFAALDYMPSLHGTPQERIAFFRAWVEAAAPAIMVELNGVRIKGISLEDAQAIKQIAWSLGGVATSYLRPAHKAGDPVDLVVMFEGIEEVWIRASDCRFPGCEDGIEITAVDPLEGRIEMSCIKTDRDDGLYVMEGHLVTHNTELLLGIVSQTLMWSSGFLFIDGKGTTEFYARAWSLCKRFGREDDLRVLNFTDPGNDPDAPAGGPGVQSNTLNPFAKGGADQLMNLIVGLMGDNGGKGGDMWQQRAMSLVTAAMKALVEMRDSGDILLDVQAVRDFLPLGTGVSKELLRNKKINSIDDIPDEAWSEMRTRAGMIELYLRALKGDFSNATRLALKGFFDSLPGFNLQKALNGDPQDGKASEQYGFLAMQLTKPLGSLADDYGHIFRTPLGEVDMDDVVYNRRILIVLLPALQKAKAEMEMCGKIVVNLMKIMMGNASGSMLHGSRREIVEAKQTRAPSPFIAVLDEAGYYLVKGVDVMMAQARSIGFQIVLAAQDQAALQSLDAQVAETAAANASLFAAGKTVDGDKTLNFIQRIFGKAHVSVTSGFSKEQGIFSSKWVDRQDASFQEVERVRLNELQNMMEGEFYFLFNGTIVRASTFYIGGDFTEGFSVNKFVKVRGPMDRVPGLDQSVEEAFYADYLTAFETLATRVELGAKAPKPEVPKDDLAKIERGANEMLLGMGRKGVDSDAIQTAWLISILQNALLSQDEPEEIGIEEIEDEDWSANIGDMFDDDDLERETEAERRMARRRHVEGGDIARNLSAVATGLTPRERHQGVVNVLLEQTRAKEKVARAAGLVIDESQDPGEAEEQQQSISSLFSVISQKAAQISEIFAEEDVDGEIGLEILRKSGAARPVKMPEMDSEDLEATIGNLTKMFEEKEQEEL